MYVFINGYKRYYYFHKKHSQSLTADTASDGRTSSHRSRRCEDEALLTTRYCRLHFQQFEFRYSIPDIETVRITIIHFH